MTTTRHGSATFEYTDRTVTIQRSFDAPRSLVFDALTKPEHVRVWFSPDPTPLHMCEIDLRVGGTYHYAWYAPGDMECSFRGTFLTIERPTQIVATWLFEGWPKDEAVETVILTEDGGITTVTRTWEFKNAASLGDHFQGDPQGMQDNLNNLEDRLADLQAGHS
jgi:uncharacterized protein YndB with AHSA1/START domain